MAGTRQFPNFALPRLHQLCLERKYLLQKAVNIFGKPAIMTISVK
jgi:hypothetical protein